MAEILSAKTLVGAPKGEKMARTLKNARYNFLAEFW